MLSHIDIKQSVHNVLETKKKTYPQYVNRISSLDDDCLRRLYYSRHDWDKQEPVEDSLQGIFETGNILEPVIERIISELGNAANPKWRIVGNQMPTKDKLLRDYEISGTIDGLLQIEIEGVYKTVAVADIKTMSPYVFQSLHDYNSLGRYEWTRKYRGQLMLYALAYEVDNCVIIAVNKSNLYEIKMIDFPVDMQYCENLLQKAEIINKAVKNDDPPEGINDPERCQNCRFKSFCCPPKVSTGNTIASDNSELEAVLERLEELSKAKREITELEKIRDQILVKGQDISIGDFLITWKEVKVCRKAQDAQEYTQWRKKVIRT